MGQWDENKVANFWIRRLMSREGSEAVRWKINLQMSKSGDMHMSREGIEAVRWKLNLQYLKSESKCQKKVVR